MANVGIIGHGVVGSGVADILWNSREVLARRAGETIELQRVCDLRDFPAAPYADRMTKDAEQIYAADDIDIVVECMGGKGAAYRFVKAALERGKHVVTSNKELIADCGEELERIARETGVCLRYEASCGGGIPVIKPIEEDLAANRITRVAGILNGTTNYILTRMREGGVSFDAALKEAQQKGYAEADPSADVLGWDARRKICILAHVAFGTPLADSAIRTEGIDRLTREDMLYARELGRSVKLLAEAERTGFGWRACVTPAMLPDSHPLACVSDVFNAVLVLRPRRGDGAHGQRRLRGRAGHRPLPAQARRASRRRGAARAALLYAAAAALRARAHGPHARERGAGPRRLPRGAPCADRGRGLCGRVRARDRAGAGGRPAGRGGAACAGDALRRADPLPDAIRRRPIVPHAGSGTARPCAGDGGEGGLRSPIVHVMLDDHNLKKSFHNRKKRASPKARPHKEVI